MDSLCCLAPSGLTKIQPLTTGGAWDWWIFFWSVSKLGLMGEGKTGKMPPRGVGAFFGEELLNF